MLPWNPWWHRRRGAPTFAAWHGGAPHHVAVLQGTGDGLRALRPDEAVVALEGHRAAQQEPVPGALSIDGDAGVVALVLTERWTGEGVEVTSVRRTGNNLLASAWPQPSALSSYRQTHTVSADTAL